MAAVSEPRVIHTAQALVDEVIELPELPVRGSNAVATSRTRYAASAVNVLLAAARSGARCVHAGSIGSGPNGDLVRSVLHTAGVRISSPPVPRIDTGVCLVLLEPSAERTFVTVQGAERVVTEASLGTSEPVPGDVVCVSGYSLFGATRDPLLAWLDTLPDGVAVVLDPGAPFADLDDDALGRTLARTTVWTGNADEADGLARRGDGAPPRDAATPTMPIAESAPRVASLLPDGAVVVVRDGPAGCVVTREGRTTTHPGFPETPVDTNGAGDTHTGVLVAQVAAGAPWDVAVERANAAGAIKVTRRGPDTAPTAAEIDAFLSGAPAPPNP